MIWKTTAAVLAMLGMAACGGSGTNPFMKAGEETPATPVDGETINGIPAKLARNVTQAAYDPVSETLSLTMQSLDAPKVVASFKRNAALDLPGYQAYSVQDDALDRHFTALAAMSPDPQNSVQAGVAGDGGQFNYYYSGGYYSRRAPYSVPSNAGNPKQLVSYAGNYAAVTNMNVDSDSPNNDKLPTTVTGTLTPQQAARIKGDIFFNVSFSDNAVNGAITNRQLLDGDPANGAGRRPGVLNLPDIVLVKGVIDNTAGTFAGEVEHAGKTGENIGTFGGIFGGTNATGMAGIVQMTEIDEADNLGLKNEQEHGVFVLTQCGTPADAPVCANVNP